MLPDREMQALKTWTRAERKIASFRRLLDIAGIDPEGSPEIRRELRRLRRRADRRATRCNRRVEPLAGALMRQGGDVTQALVKRDPSLPALTGVPTIDEAMALGKVFADSGFFTGAASQAKAATKILAGAELGFPPMVSLSGLDVIEGKVTLSAGLMSTLIQRSGIFSYRIVHLDGQACELEFSRNGIAISPSVRFTMEDARRAGLAGKKNWIAYPQDMLYARAMSRGYRRYCTLLSGGPLYTPEELESPIDVQASTVEEPGPATIDAEVVEILPVAVDASAVPEAPQDPPPLSDEVRQQRRAEARELALALHDQSEQLAGWYANGQPDQPRSREALADEIIGDVSRAGLRLRIVTAAELLSAITADNEPGSAG